jgi:hypothetical protein
MTDLICYRGEKKSSWGTPELRLNDGLTVRRPLGGATIPTPEVEQLWRVLRGLIATNSNGDVRAFTQSLRARGNPHAIATARTAEGSYDTDYNYVIAIPNAHVFSLKRLGNTKLAWEMDTEEQWVDDVAGIDRDYVVLNSASLAGASVLGVGHKAWTCEVTFFTDTPTSMVTKVNTEARDDYLKGHPLKPKNSFTPDEKLLMRDLVRPQGKF